MIGRWGLYSDLMRAFKGLGMGPDEADRAARLAERTMIARRDHFIRAAAASGMSYRRIARVWGLSKSHVQRVVSPDTASKGTAVAGTLGAKDKPASVRSADE